MVHVFLPLRPAPIAWLLAAIFCSGTVFALPPEISKIFEPADLNRCGPLSLRACATFLAAPVDERQLERYLPDDGRVTTFSQLAHAAHELGFATAAIRWHGRPMLPRIAPAILALKVRGSPHFVASVGRRGDRVVIIDFPDAAWGSCQRLRDELHWDGEALHIARSNWCIAWLYALLYWRPIVLGLIGIEVFIVLMRRRRTGRLHASNSQLVRMALALACLGCLGFVLGCRRGASELPPVIARIEPDSVVVDSSNPMSEKGEVETVLHVTNEGNVPLKIRRIASSCGCTMAGEPTATLLDSGQTADIPFTVVPPSFGEKKSRVAVLVEAGTVQQTLVATFLMRGRRIQAPAIVHVPREIVLRCNANGTAKTTVEIRTYEESESRPWIERAMSDSTIVAVKSLGMKEGMSPESGVSVRAYSYSLSTQQLHDDSTENTHPTACITLVSANVDVPVGTFYVRIEKWQPFRLVPKLVFLGGVDRADDCIERRIRVVFDDERFRPTKVDAESDAPWIQVRSVAFSDQADRKEALVTVELQPGRMPKVATVRGSLVVRASDGQTDWVEVTAPVIVKLKSVE